MLTNVEKNGNNKLAKAKIYDFFGVKQMNKSTKTVIGVVLFVAIILVAVGYAAVTNIPLNITGSATAEVNTNNFKVTFTDPITTGGKGSTIAAKTDATTATMTVTGLTAKGDTATATYTIQNTSDDLLAKFSVDTVSESTDYFKVTSEVANTDAISPAGTTTVTVTVELLKTPIDADAEAANLSTTIGVKLLATPVQPN